MSSTERQFALLDLLRAPGDHTLSALARRLGVSKNTVQRDIDRLSAAVPITESRRGQTLFYAAAAVPPSVPASRPRPDAPTLAPALSALRPWRRTRWYAAAVRQLQEGALDTSAFDAATPEPNTTGGERMMRELCTGLLEHRRVRLTYRPRANDDAVRLTLEPARLRMAAGLLYLDAFPAGPGALRTYVVHRVVEARATKARFTPRPLPPRTAFGAVEAAPVDACVRFAPEVADFIRERSWHPSQRLDVQPDGSLLWRASVSGEHEFLGWVLSWAPWAELVEPATWREKLQQNAAHMARVHRSAI